MLVGRWGGVNEPHLVFVEGKGRDVKRTEDENEKILLTGEDQVYIQGHHLKGLDYIADVDPEELKKSEGELTVIALGPHQLTRRFCDCFQSSETFTGKIKFYNCQSGVDGGALFARPAATMLRASFPNALYIGYKGTLSQAYGNYALTWNEIGPKVFAKRARLRRFGAAVAPIAAVPITERRKLGLTKKGVPTGQRAKQLQVDIPEETEKDSLKGLLVNLESFHL
jgi:hypothetical protein